MRNVSLSLILGDVILSVFALYSGFFLRFGSLPKLEELFNLGGARVYIVIVVLIFSSFFMEIYNHEKDAGKKVTFLKILLALFISFIILSSIYYLIPPVMFGRGILLLSLCVFSLFQFFYHATYKTCINFHGFARRVLILGTGQLAKRIGETITSTNHKYVLAGYYNCTNELEHVPARCILNNGNGNGLNGDGLIDTIKKNRAHKIVISLSERRGVFPLRDVLSCKLSGIEVADAPSFYEQITGKLLIENLTPSWFIFSDGFKITPLKRIYKRVFDLFFAAPGLIISLPLLPVIALLIKIDSPGPVFFRQIRIGEGEKKFLLYKFRTMRSDAESKTGAVWAQKNDERITRVGSFLRKTRLDEIPQLFNVIRGDMSFIGPRPERPEFVEKLKEIIPYYSERHFVKPGITGWAQIKYPYGASVEDAIEKLRYDLFYMKHISIFLDLLIILETIKVVILGRGGR